MTEVISVVCSLKPLAMGAQVRSRLSPWTRGEDLGEGFSIQHALTVRAIPHPPPLPYEGRGDHFAQRASVTDTTQLTIDQHYHERALRFLFSTRWRDYCEARRHVNLTRAENLSPPDSLLFSDRNHCTKPGREKKDIL